MILSDGAMGQELIHRSGDNPHPLWSTKVMIDHPHLVQEIHADYFNAGAIIATSNTYAIHRDRLRHFDMEDEFRALHESALSIVNQARDAHGSGYIAGAMGPLMASYRPDLSPPAEEAAESYAEIAQIQAAFVDFFLLETMASVDQARGAIMGASVPNKPIWLAVSVDDKDGTRLRSGEPLTELFDGIKEFSISALLINCSLPEAVTQSIPLMPETWPDDGATILGGCCEIGPAHIAKIRDRMDSEGYTRTKEIQF